MSSDGLQQPQPSGSRPGPAEIQQLRQTGKRIDAVRAAVSEEELAQVAESNPLNAPFQLEVHPYSIEQDEPCNNKCPHCTKGDDKFELAKARLQGIEPDKLIGLIQHLSGRGTQGVILSGNSTEPLMYPRIDEVMRAIKEGDGSRTESPMFMRLYSNFYFGQKVVDVADALDGSDYVRVSLDAGSSRAYNSSHAPSDPEAFGVILSNMADLTDKRRELEAAFSVNITFLLTQKNSQEGDIRDIVKWSIDNDIDSIRFNVPLIPQGAAGQFCQDNLMLPPDELEKRLGLLRELKAEHNDLIIIANDNPEQGEKPFSHCHHWKMVAVLGASGFFFPCTSVSLTRNHGNFGRFDVNDPGFDFDDFWKQASKWQQIDPKACSGGSPMECTRFEFAVNDLVENQVSAPPTDKAS